MLIENFQDSPSGFCFVNNVAVGAAHGEPSPVFLIVVRVCLLRLSASQPQYQPRSDS